MKARNTARDDIQTIAYYIDEDERGLPADFVMLQRESVAFLLLDLEMVHLQTREVENAEGLSVSFHP